ncbi:hypothetical protein EB796_019441 [Bugula neritina]|uniref:Uncharacterized protein n=1 Tax=Bugula neritina TaxID=10212 RepID=A0A7J7J9D8_BUGNE|nr:hypothetical protein EB796_019441 [Bugula neritina]
MVKILFTCPKLSTSGNFTSAMRIRAHLQTFGHHVDVCSIADSLLLSPSSIHSYSIIFTIHAYKSTGLLKVISEDTKLVLLFGGTDLNENMNL